MTQPLILAVALTAALAGAPALAQQTVPDTISTSTPAAASAAPAPAAVVAPTATAGANPTPEQQAALAGARPAPLTAAAAPPPVGSLLQTIVSLGLVIGLLLGLAWLLKRFGPRTITGGTTVKLVGALSVGARERILVVEVGEQWIVVGASPGRMNALATMPRQAVDSNAQAPAVPGAQFAEWLKHTVDKRHGK